MIRPATRSFVLGALAASACGDPSPARRRTGEPARTEDPRASPVAAAIAPSSATDGRASSDPEVLAALARGRAAFEAKDFARAVAAFEAAVAIAPTDARALSELGWAALHAGDLARAETVLALAVELATEAKLAGAAWYNLGRVREAQGRRDDAAKAYETSLGLREHAIVRQRLAQVHTPAAPHRPKLDVERLAGPWPALLSWCVDEALREDIPVEQLDCDLEVTSEDEIAVAVPVWDPSAGIREAKFVARLQDGSVEAVRLALRTEAGWFVGPQIGSHGLAGAFGIHFDVQHLAIEEVELVRGGGPELLVRVHGSTMNLDTEGRTQYEDEYDDRRVCGVGRSGTPSCTSPIPLVGTSIAFDEEQHTTTEERWAFALKVVRGGVVLSGVRAELDAHHRAWLGKHSIAFP